MDEQEDDMGDDNKLYTNDHEYPWGETANYKVVEPVTPHARRAAKKAIARQRREEREALIAEAHYDSNTHTAHTQTTPDSDNNKPNNNNNHNLPN